MCVCMSSVSEAEGAHSQASHDDGRRSSSTSPLPSRAQPPASDQTLILGYVPLRAKTIPTVQSSAHTLKPKKLSKEIQKLLKEIESNDDVPECMEKLSKGERKGKDIHKACREGHLEASEKWRQR